MGLQVKQQWCERSRVQSFPSTKNVSNRNKILIMQNYFSFSVKMTSIPIIQCLAKYLNLEIEQLDVKTIFLHGVLE